MESLKLTADELHLAALTLAKSARTGKTEKGKRLKDISSKLKTQAILEDVRARGLG